MKSCKEESFYYLCSMYKKTPATDEQFRTIVDIPHATFHIKPAEHMLLVGSCFADSIGQRLQDDHFSVVVNPFGVMYNPASILHSITRIAEDVAVRTNPFTCVILTLGTNHVYVEKATGEIVDNCQKRPQALFDEQEFSVNECADYLDATIQKLRELNPDIRVILTVSPIRYRKYGYHESQLSKSTLLLAVDKVTKYQSNGYSDTLFYFPAYEILNDELRDYRFYATDMIHPSEQAVDYIYHRFQETFFSEEAWQYIDEWRPIREALAHRPFHPDSSDALAFKERTQKHLKAFEEKWKLKESKTSKIRNQ